MTRTTFNSPFLLGFDQLERALDRVSKTGGDGYPPYNIEQLGPDLLRITLAVAGFRRGDLQLTLEDNQLIIRGKREEPDDRVYLHRGIATRQFLRSFVLAEGMEVAGAELAHGLLHIDLARPKPNISVRTIAIVDAEEPGAPRAGQTPGGRSKPPETGSAG